MRVYYSMVGIMRNYLPRLKILTSDYLWSQRNLRILAPFTWLYIMAITMRRWYLCKFQCQKFKVPIIVVGNITVGGTGKTPAVIAIAEYFTKRGLKVGIISRGYQGNYQEPYLVKVDDHASMVGDEPLLIARRTGLPVMLAKQRTLAIQALLDDHKVDIIISDDGLQHYAFTHSVEIAVVDGMRLLGNGKCLPQGPLREPAMRLATVDFVLVNGLENFTSAYCKKSYFMQLLPQQFIHLVTSVKVSCQDLPRPFLAVAAIGNPERFFATLKALGIICESHVFPDHYMFTTRDEILFKQATILMTEKDAVKCVNFATSNMYYLPVDALFPDEFWSELCAHKNLINI
jgi:tetraacyldisaccharide 4'-kinase